ncbi:MAG TPA: SIS domain-containing protein [Gemmatimonadaceae bacterium]|nr:SIS domain-containing protein [Gemmatimonadaceae bacterium]
MIASREALRSAAGRRLALGAEITAQFFEAEADAVARACAALARRFERGGRLLAFGEGSAMSDAQHVAVEFVHPVLVGKRALSALAVEPSSVALLGRTQDIALAISHASPGDAVARALREARARGMLTVALSGAPADAAFAFVVPCDDACVVQEVQETLYHVLWELVHVFFEQRVLGLR